MRKVLVPMGVAALLALVTGCATLNGWEGGGPKTQGWTRNERVAWYAATQGSRLLPLAWARALIDVQTGAPFFGDASLARFGYLPSTTAPGLGFAVGFAADDNDDTQLTYTKLRWYADQGSREPWLGLNCAACHTATIAYHGQQKLIDGAPTMADFQAFTEAFDTSLAATLNEDARFSAFAAQVLAGRDTPANRALLKQQLTLLVAWEEKVQRVNQTALRYGPARLDAVGHIFNKLALLAEGAGFAGNPSDAPVSYPFLWNTHQADKLQWNGMALNQDIAGFDIGALGRNAGEVMGVFGDAAITPGAGLAGYPSSIQVDSVAGLEVVLSRLEPPLWPTAMLGRIDRARVAVGKALYANNCAGCHQVIAPQDLTTTFKATMVPFNVPGTPGPGTDIAMACNAYLAQAPTGKLKGTPIGYIDKRGAQRFGPTGQLTDMLPTTVIGVLANQKAAVLDAGVTIFLGGAPSPRVVPTSAGLVGAVAARPRTCDGIQSKILAYKARPLNGIWATAPYLHNGSVPTLYDLLLPAAQRPKTFYVGSREFDPVKVGFVTARSAANAFPLDTSIRGNFNGGHEYTSDRVTGRVFTEAQRMALVEYMKTL